MLVNRIEEYINSKIDGDFIYPQYDGYSLYNVIPTIFNLFGIPQNKKSLPMDVLKDFISINNKIVFFLIDGFGFNKYKKIGKDLELIDRITEKGKIFPITSIFPSTTAASLTTIATGKTPQEHGLFEWNLYIKEIGKVIQTLPFTNIGKTSESELLIEEGVSPEVLLSSQENTIYQSLGKFGIKSYVFFHQSILNSTYSSLISKNAICISYNYLSDLLIKLKQYLTQDKESAFFYVYWPNIDGQEHKFGLNSEESDIESKIFFYALMECFIKKFKKEETEDIIIMLTADHGQVEVNPEETIYLNNDEKLLKMFAEDKNGNMILPWGSPRDVFLSINKNKIEEALYYLREKYSREAKILEIKDALNLQLFGVGDISTRFLDRAGEILMLPYNGNTIWYEYIKGELFNFKGHHGGLSKDEMIIPFGIANLKDLI